MTKEEILQIAKPILFNTDMVRAILDGKKSMTRRLVKPRYRDDEYGFQILTNMGTGARYIEKTDENEMCFDSPRYIHPPYQAGDYLYVREAWSERSYGYIYKADGEKIDNLGNVIKWHPSIHMPKEAARIFLQVTDVRVERLQDMESSNDEQYHAEGAKDKHDFIRIWNNTIDPAEIEKYGWYANPWVWVIEFERVEVQQ